MERPNFTKTTIMENVMEKEWRNYFQQLNEAEKKSVLQMLKAFLQSRNANTKHISIEQYNAEIDEALLEVERGEVLSQEEVEKMAKSW